MSNIQYIKNVTTFKSFGTAFVNPATAETPEEKVKTSVMGEMSIQLNSLPDLTPDEVIIRGISYNSYRVDDDLDDNVYLIRSNIGENTIIGSLVGGVSTSVFPQTVIKLVSPISNILEFQIHAPDGMNVSRVVDKFSGDLAIHLDFIKYKRPVQEPEKESEKNI